MIKRKLRKRSGFSPSGDELCYGNDFPKRKRPETKTPMRWIYRSFKEEALFPAVIFNRYGDGSWEGADRKQINSMRWTYRASKKKHCSQRWYRVVTATAFGRKQTGNKRIQAVNWKSFEGEVCIIISGELKVVTATFFRFCKNDWKRMRPMQR